MAGSADISSGLLLVNLVAACRFRCQNCGIDVLILIVVLISICWYFVLLRDVPAWAHPEIHIQQGGQLLLESALMSSTCFHRHVSGVFMQYQQSLGISTTILRRQARPKKKTMANLDNVRRTIYICDIASKANHPHEPHTMYALHLASM